MLKQLGVACGLIAAISCANRSSSSNMDKEANSDKGWISLFDGKTTKGWHTFNADTIGSAWKVQDGALYLDASQMVGWQSKSGGDIVTDASFDEFHLKLEWKISKNGNSGIMCFVQEGKQYSHPWKTGPEIQVLDNDGHPDGKIQKHRAGDLYDMIKSDKETVKPVGEWNLAEVIFDDNKLELRLNGHTAVTTTVGDQAWKDLIAGSKFKDMPGFGTITKGKIALQDHGNEVWFRNIMIKKL
jgi:Domain of Unknown Function (DUF1080)